MSATRQPKNLRLARLSIALSDRDERARINQSGGCRLGEHLLKIVLRHQLIQTKRVGIALLSRDELLKSDTVSKHIHGLGRPPEHRIDIPQLRRNGDAQIFESYTLVVIVLSHPVPGALGL